MQVADFIVAHETFQFQNYLILSFYYLFPFNAFFIKFDMFYCLSFVIISQGCFL